MNRTPALRIARRCTPLNRAIVANSVWLILAVTTASAQQPPDRFETLADTISNGDVLVITDGDGHRHRGRLTMLDATALEILEDDVATEASRRRIRPTRFESSEIARIDTEVRDAPWNGIAAGAALGAAPILAWTALRSHGSDPPGTGLTVGVTSFTAVIGAAIGWFIDNRIVERTTIYRAGAAQPHRLGIAVDVSHSTATARVSIAWGR